MCSRPAPEWSKSCEILDAPETFGSGRAASSRQPDLLRGLFGRACLQPRLQAAARPARPDLSAISGDAGAVGARRRAGQGHRRKAVPGFGHADAAAQAPRGRPPRQAHALARGRTSGADRADPAGPCLEGKSARRAAIDPGGVGLLGLGAGRDEGRDRRAAGSVECGDRGVGGAASSILSYLAASFSPQSRFFANARPEADFRYFSNATALASSLKAMQVLMRHGPYFDVCGTSPALCFASRARRSSVMPM